MPSPGSFVQGATGNAVPCVISFPSNNTAGNLLVFTARVVANSSTSSITDTLNNAWVKAFEQAYTSGQTLVVWYCLSAKVGANTVTFSYSGASFIRGAVGEWASSGTNSLDVIGTLATGSSSVATANSLSTSKSDILIACASQSSIASSSAVAGGGFTTEVSDTAVSNDIVLADNIALPGTYTPTVTWSGSTNWGIVTLAFTLGSKPTPGVVGLGTFQGSSFAAAFPTSANPIGLDLMQVVNEGGQVVWNLNSNGVSATNPANPTFEVLLAKYFGPSLSAVFLNPLKYDLLQIKGAGGAVVFHVDYLGNVNIP